MGSDVRRLRGDAKDTGGASAELPNQALSAPPEFYPAAAEASSGEEAVYSVANDPAFGYLFPLRARWLLRRDRTIDAGERDDLLAALRKRQFVSMCRESLGDLERVVGAAPVGGLLDWLVQHWPQILQILLALLMIFVEEPEA